MDDIQGNAADVYGFAVVHVPHASVEIPEKYRASILLSDKALRREVARMTDAFCDDLYDAPEFPVRVVAQMSRMVCDVERFRDDRLERQARRGQGLMYTRTYWGRRIRRYDKDLRDMILREIYDPHHAGLEAAVDGALSRYGKCLIIDGHSFNSKMIIKPDNIISLPDFDIGTDSFHTPPGLRDAVCGKVRELGFSLKLNSPFGGAITPMKHYRKDGRVFSIMIETNRKLYMDEKNMVKSEGFDRARGVCRELMLRAAQWVSEN